MTYEELLKHASNLWGYQLFKIGETEIKTNQLFIAFFMLIFGIYVIKKTQRYLKFYMLKKKKVPVASQEVVLKLFFYSALVMLVLTCFQIIGIPISSFAFMGGALAIGVGFGAQNILNNFISGLIILFEQPVRVGDFIKINEELGVVHDIGARCTKIFRSDGVELLVPNSTLLENTISNWTLQNPRIRFTVSVGVAYGSDTKLVHKLMNQVCEEEDQILKDPKHEVVFEEFGANSLDFTAYFWANTDSLFTLKRIASRLRFKIDDLFKEHNISIAFPQRDVHLDVKDPIQILLKKD